MPDTVSAQQKSKYRSASLWYLLFLKPKNDKKDLIAAAKAVLTVHFIFIAFNYDPAKRIQSEFTSS